MADTWLSWRNANWDLKLISPVLLCVAERDVDRTLPDLSLCQYFGRLANGFQQIRARHLRMPVTLAGTAASPSELAGKRNNRSEIRNTSEHAATVTSYPFGLLDGS